MRTGTGTNQNRYEPEPGFKDLGLNRTEPNRGFDVIKGYPLHMFEKPLIHT